MTDTELKEILTRHLGDKLFFEKRGQILYSGIDTLIKEDFYFLGFNPAEDGTNPLLCEVPLNLKNWSAYTQQCWYCGSYNADPKHAKKPHQRRVVRIMSELGLVPEKTFAANLIFVQSKKAKQMKYDGDEFDRCWLVHEEMLAVVQPKYIICLGNGEDHSAFSFLRQRAGMEIQRVATENSYKSFDGMFRLKNNHELKPKVIGVRHPSRFKPSHFQTLSSLCAEC